MTGRILKFRIADHRGYILNQVHSKATGAHFNLPGHSLANMNFTVIEQVKYNNEAYREEKETYHFNQFNTFYRTVVLCPLCAKVFNKTFTLNMWMT